MFSQPVAKGFTDNIHVLSVSAAPGETNRVEVTLLDGYRVRLHDPAGLTGTSPCAAEDAHTVLCTPTSTPTGWRLTAALGDGDDTVAGTFPSGAEIDGGEGNDVLAVAGGRLTGGPGDDRLSGTEVQGGPGADVLEGTTLSYADHTDGISLDVAGDNAAGAPGENDRVLPGFVSVIGGAGPDVIRSAGDTTVHGRDGDDVIDGSDQNDTIYGEGGSDVIRGHGGFDHLSGDADADRLEGGADGDRINGGGGRDVLVGDAGRDTLIGEAGADVFLARDGERDDIRCGDDDMWSTPRLQGDRATLDQRDAQAWCDRVDRSGPARLELHGLERVGSRGLRLIASCPRRAPRACVGDARLRSDGALPAVSARRRVRVAPGRRARLTLRLNRRVRTRPYELFVRVRTRDADGRRLVVRTELPD